MAKYIDRDAVCYQLQKRSTIDGQRRAFRRAEKIVAAFPVADVVERKTGKWEDKGHDNIYQCSVCSDLWMGIGGYRFCPNCGAQMIGGDDDV